jgi:2-C-methyl-D-erythritol 4-phosphate cytidylyltransferase
MIVSAIVPAAGQGKRLGAGKPKALVTIGGKPLLIHTLLNLEKSFKFHEIIVAVEASRLKEITNLIARYDLKNIRVVVGGKTRAESVKNALLVTSAKSEWVLVHDAARPLVGPALIKKILQAAKSSGAAICALPATSTVKKVDASLRITGTEDRNSLYLAQTPQVFKKDLLIGAYIKLGKRSLGLTDEASFFDGSKFKVKIVEGDSKNIKITTPEDVDLFKFYLRRAK